jgi:restriction endonuclease S subunit
MKLKDLFEIRNGELIKEAEMKETGLYPVFSSTKEAKPAGYIDNPRIVLNEYDMYLTSRGGSAGIINQVHQKIATTQTTITLKRKTTKEIARYTYLYLKANEKKLFKSENIAIKQITKKDVINIEIPIPKDILKIIDILEKQISLIELKEKELYLEKQKLKWLQQEIL